MGLWREIGAWRGLDAAQRRKVTRALATVGLARSRRSVRSGALSGGQFQRVLFARLLLQDASLILLDEPFRAVDTKTIADLIALILRWHGEGRTVLAALHDIEQVRAHFPDDSADRARGGGLGRDAQSADAKPISPSRGSWSKRSTSMPRSASATRAQRERQPA